MIRSINQKPKGKIEIDLTGPDGNAFALMGMATRWAKQMKLDKDAIMAEMMSGDYENLLSIMEKYFGDYIIMYR
jgi:hypothetical protein